MRCSGLPKCPSNSADIDSMKTRTTFLLLGCPGFSIFNWFGYTGTTLGLMFGEFSYIVAFVLFLCLSFLFVFLSRILLHRTCRDIQRVSAEKFHWKPELLTLLCSTLLIGVCLFGIRGRMGYNPIKVSAAYYFNNTFFNQLKMEALMCLKK